MTIRNTPFLDQHAPLSLFALVFALVSWSMLIIALTFVMDPWALAVGSLNRGEGSAWQPSTMPGVSERRGTVEEVLWYVDYVQTQDPSGYMEFSLLDLRTRWDMVVLVYSTGCAVLVACYVLWRRWVRWVKVGTTELVE